MQEYRHTITLGEHVMITSTAYRATLNRDDRRRFDAMVRRITRQFRRADAADLAAGLGWYAEALRVARAIASAWGVSVETAVGIIAAKSPQCRWSTNVVVAERIVAAAVRGDAECPRSGLTATSATAWRIAQGEAPLSALGTVSPTGRVISGHKVRSFYANILGDTDAVTVDMWAYAVALDAWRTDERTGERIPTDATMSAGQYVMIAWAYRHAAAILGVTPRECQAACWVAARGVKPSDAAFHAAASVAA